MFVFKFLKRQNVHPSVKTLSVSVWRIVSQKTSVVAVNCVALTDADIPAKKVRVKPEMELLCCGINKAYFLQDRIYITKPLLTTPNPSKSFSWFCLILMDSVLHSIAQRIEYVATCTKSIKLPPAAFLGFRIVYSQAMDALHLLPYQFHQKSNNWDTFLLHVDGFRRIWDGV